ncbi:preprotein translocase subunit SecG [Porphyromonas sp.]|nr:preprotein translocase subunit SecG [uncultured Porphyromonas sp.]
MFTLITVLILIASLALVLLVIVQKSKGGGLASPFASSNNIMGVRKTTDVLEKATWWLFGAIAVLCVASTHFLGSGATAESKTQQTLEQNAAKAPAPTALPNLGGGTAPAAAPAEQAPAGQPAQ